VKTIRVMASSTGISLRILFHEYWNNPILLLC
jgi:hypothetical protein